MSICNHAAVVPWGFPAELFHYTVDNLPEGTVSSLLQPDGLLSTVVTAWVQMEGHYDWEERQRVKCGSLMGFVNLLML